jgi:Fe-S cluster assembly ATP-binding protein
MLKLTHYSVSVNDKPILKNISLNFEEGKTYVIMGPNGSGKSTLALSLMGSPDFVVNDGGSAEFLGSDLLSLKAQERAQAGLAITFQSPPSLSGVTVFQLLRVALSGKMSPQDIRTQLLEYAKELKIPKELLSRSLNDGFSGGERKKMEMLQIALLKPRLVFFDEIDTGVDVDALRTITTFLKKHKRKDQIFVFITHQKRLADFVSPDTVVILKDGKVVKTGDAELIREIEEGGYNNF